MSLEEILTSDVEITYELLKENKITLSMVKNAQSSIVAETNGRYIEILLIFERKNEFDNNIKFILLMEYIFRKDYSKALEYARCLCANTKDYKSDYLTFLLLLSELTGEHLSELDNLKKEDLYVRKYDIRFASTYTENKIRAYIYDGNYDAAYKMYKHLYKKSLPDCDTIINRLLKGIIKTQEKKIVDNIENYNYSELMNYYEHSNQDSKKTELEINLLEMLDTVMNGISLPGKRELPKELNIYNAVETFNIEAAGSLENSPIVASYIRKIKEENQSNVEDDYVGLLSPYLNYTLENVYYSIEEQDFENAQNSLIDYLTYIYKEEWIDIILEKLNKIEETEEDDKTSVLAELFDALVEISRPNSVVTEKYLKEKYTGETLKYKPYSKTHEIDLEYNYGIPNIDEIITSIKDKTIDYREYANKTHYTEDDLYTLAIMARENYRLSETAIGDTLIRIVTSLMKENKVKSSELSFFIKAIVENKNKLPKKQTSFIKQIKILTRG